MVDTSNTTLPVSSTASTTATAKNPLLRMMLEAKLKLLKKREMVAEIGKLAAAEEERRSQEKLASALRRIKRKEEMLLRKEEGDKMEERSMGAVEERGMFEGSPLQSAMTEFFRTSTPGPLEEAATTPAPFTLTGNTLLGGPNGTASSLRFGNRKLIAATERSDGCHIQ